MSVSYNANDPILRVPRYRRLAQEHVAVFELKSDRIKWRVVEEDTHLKIPIRYEIDYYVRSIIGIEEDQSPIYGDKHTVEISFPAKFPLETFKAKTITKIWHPNIKWDGPTEGRICVNNRQFGSGYDMYMLALRIGEIIQYKNYLAENIPPYPEDSKVAKWVLDYAEPHGIVNVKEKIATDNSNLLEYTAPQEIKKKITIKQVNKAKIKIVKVPKKGGENGPQQTIIDD